jgi:regulator of cell morphogenesis and NO signaling
MSMTTTTTLADVAATSLSAVRTLERHGLDYCCGGKQPLDEACAAKGLKLESILREIELAQGPGASERDWQTAPLDEMVKHIVGTHHEYLKVELPALGNRMNKVLAVHGPKDQSTLSRLADVFGSLRAEMEMHMHKEEFMIFPFLEQYGRAETLGQSLPPVPFGSVANPIGMMEREHEAAGGALLEIRELTCGFEYPSYACSTVRALFDGLKALEADLHVHIHLENNILFPRAIALERSRSKDKGSASSD